MQSQGCDKFLIPRGVNSTQIWNAIALTVIGKDSINQWDKEVFGVLCTSASEIGWEGIQD